jgi:hypothetical protein
VQDFSRRRTAPHGGRGEDERGGCNRGGADDKARKRRLGGRPVVALPHDFSRGRRVGLARCDNQGGGLGSDARMCKAETAFHSVFEADWLAVTFYSTVRSLRFRCSHKYQSEVLRQLLLPIPLPNRLLKNQFVPLGPEYSCLRPSVSLEAIEMSLTEPAAQLLNRMTASSSRPHSLMCRKCPPRASRHLSGYLQRPTSTQRHPRGQARDERWIQWTQRLRPPTSKAGVGCSSHKATTLSRSTKSQAPQNI